MLDSTTEAGVVDPLTFLTGKRLLGVGEEHGMLTHSLTLTHLLALTHSLTHSLSPTLTKPFSNALYRQARDCWAWKKNTACSLTHSHSLTHSLTHSHSPILQCALSTGKRLLGVEEEHGMRLSWPPERPLMPTSGPI